MSKLTRREMLGATTGAIAAATILGTGLVAIDQGADAFRTPRFPNCVLQRHDGIGVRFYDDLVRGKVVALNMMYAKCEGICPRMTENLLAVQTLLGAHLGRDVFMYSITLQPQHDTPAVLARYMERQREAPRWPFLTGAPTDVERIRRRLGFYDDDPQVDGDKRQHTGMVRIGNDRLGRWTMVPALARPTLIAQSILQLRALHVRA